MSDIKTIAIEEMFEILRGYDCRPCNGRTPLNTAHWWRYPWGGYPFPVPCEDGRIDMVAHDRVIADMIKAAPLEWSFGPDADNEADDDDPTPLPM